MEPSSILYLIIAISSLSYVFGQLLEYINIRAGRNDLPPEVAEFYDREKYLKSLDYQRKRTTFGFITSGLGFAVSLLLLLTGGFGALDSFLRSSIQNEIYLALAFFGILILASDLLTLPFQLYSTFVIEERFGFNKTTIKTFIIDKVKGYIIGAVIGGGLLTGLLYLIQRMGPNFWIWFGIIAAIFLLIVNMFYTSLILPLFNKLTPLPDGELKTTIHSFATKISFPLDNIFVMDGSRRSAKANAFFSGIGRRKKIVLFDTLIKNHSVEELIAVLAHEVGHYKKKHVIWNYLLGITQVFLMLFIMSTMVLNSNVSLALGGLQQSLHLNLLAFAILYSPISGALNLFMMWLSRKHEFEADDFARASYDGHALGRALKKLSVDNLSNLFPHPLYVFFHYSHPPLLERLASIEARIQSGNS